MDRCLIFDFSRAPPPPARRGNFRNERATRVRELKRHTSSPNYLLIQFSFYVFYLINYI